MGAWLRVSTGAEFGGFWKDLAGAGRVFEGMRQVSRGEIDRLRRLRGDWIGFWRGI